jgi:hypothetical protein
MFPFKAQRAGAWCKPVRRKAKWTCEPGTEIENTRLRQPPLDPSKKI